MVGTSHVGGGKSMKCRYAWLVVLFFVMGFCGCGRSSLEQCNELCQKFAELPLVPYVEALLRLDPVPGMGSFSINTCSQACSENPSGAKCASQIGPLAGHDWRQRVTAMAGLVVEYDACYDRYPGTQIWPGLGRKFD